MRAIKCKRNLSPARVDQLGSLPAGGGFRRGRGRLNGGRPAPAWGAEVVSSNIVGYEKVNLISGFNMVGVQFVQVGSGSAKDLGTAIQLDDTMDGFNDEGDYATFMKVWDGANYTTYGWSGSSGTDVLDDPSLDKKWLNKDLEEVEGAVMDKSAAAWIIADGAGTMTVSGEVPSEATVTVPLTAGFNMVANPYPAKVPVSDFGVLDSSFAGFNEEGDYATFMKIWDGANYATYGWSGSSGTDVLDDSSLDNKWLNKDLEEVDKDVDFGIGVWIIAEKAGNITFTNPAN